MKKLSRQKKEKKEMTFGEQMISWAKTLLGAVVVVMIINGLAIASFVVPTGSMEKTVMTGDFLFVNKFIYGPSTPQVIPFVNVPLPYFRFPGIREPQPGDVIVFIFPGNRDEVEPSRFEYYLKRCVAIGGDTVEIIDKQLYVNGEPQPMPEHAMHDPGVPVFESEKWQTFPYGRGYTRVNYGPLRVPKKGDIIKLDRDNIREWIVFIKREGHEVSADSKGIFIDGVGADQYTVERDYCFGMGDNRDHSLDSRYWGFIPVENVVGTPIFVYWSWDTSLPITRIGDKLSSIRFPRIGTIID
ncbi:MAG: signal peptidase I [Candidatus Kapaibacterium sp.]